MLKLKNSFQIIKAVFPFADFLYILQLEEYYSIRYFKSCRRLFLRRNLQKRGKLVHTSRIQATLIISVGIYFLTFLFLFYSGIGWIAIIFPTLLIPLCIGLANTILTPFYNSLRKKVQKKAAKIISQAKNLKIIAVAGSYGKTTTKNFIYQLIKHNYKVQLIPGNINTPTGIASWIINNFDSTVEILIVEMDAYEKGEIKSSMLITPPDISVLTSVGDQHLERFENIKNLTESLLEVFEYSKSGAKLVTSQRTIGNISAVTDIKHYTHSKTLLLTKNIKTKNLSESNTENLSTALEVAKALNVPKEFIADTTKHLELPERRQKIINMYGYDVLDDSYNISFATATAGIREASRLANNRKKKLVTITAGIPELNKENKDKNFELGKLLGKKSDFVVLLSSILASEVRSGLDVSKINKKNIISAQSMNDAWIKIQKEFYAKKYFVLMQPELNDLYY